MTASNTSPSFIDRNQIRFSRIGTLVLFLALIRTITEPFRQQYYATERLTLDTFKPYLLGALFCAIGLLIITTLVNFLQYKWATVVSLLTIVSLFVLKSIYL